MKIVLVDDSELDLMINRKIIELTYGESLISSFDDSDKFFTYLEDGEDPQIIISDMQMPKTTGLELASRYIDRYGENKAKLVLLTAYVDEQIKNKVREVSECIHLVEKPLNQNILKALVSA